jgi:hypothetical protein
MGKQVGIAALVVVFFLSGVALAISRRAVARVGLPPAASMAQDTTVPLDSDRADFGLRQYDPCEFSTDA